MPCGQSYLHLPNQVHVSTTNDIRLAILEMLEFVRLECVTSIQDWHTLRIELTAHTKNLGIQDLDTTFPDLVIRFISVPSRNTIDVEKSWLCLMIKDIVFSVSESVPEEHPKDSLPAVLLNVKEGRIGYSLYWLRARHFRK
jgi:hypothetical protein